MHALPPAMRPQWQPHRLVEDEAPRDVGRHSPAAVGAPDRNCPLCSVRSAQPAAGLAGRVFQAADALQTTAQMRKPVPGV